MAPSSVSWDAGATVSGSASLPFLIRPLEGRRVGAQPAAVFFAEVDDRRRWIQERLLEHGAILFRGFLEGEATELERFLDAGGLRPMEYVRGNVRRERVRGRVFTSTEVPAYLPIPLHHEMAYSPTYPLELALLCAEPPRRGGETPIADTADLLDALPAELRVKLERHGVLYRQRVPARRRLPWRKTWREMFGVDERGEVEALCAARGIEADWGQDGSLELRSRLPAVVDHPRTGAPLWFNQIHIFHPSFGPELQRMGSPLLGTVLSLVERLMAARSPAHDVTLGDGTPFTRQEIEVVRRLLWKRAVRFAWERGDLLLIDNLRVAHGRMPYRGRRRILAALIESAPAVDEARLTRRSLQEPGLAALLPTRRSDL